MQSANVFYVRARRAGGTVEVQAPATSFSQDIRFGLYFGGEERTGGSLEGMLRFTGNFKIAPTGQVQLFEGVRIEFEDVTLTSGSRSTEFFLTNGDRWERYAITGTLTIPEGEDVTLGGLSVSKSFTVKGVGSKLRIYERFMVKSGATLRIDDVDVYFHIAGTVYIFRVDGAIEDVTKGESRPVRVANLNTSDTKEGRGAGYLLYDAYIPGDGLVDGDDCLFLKGSGTLNAGILAIAIGNLCIELKQIGPVTASGSIQNDAYDAPYEYEITADLIFLEDVVVGGDVAQWNDSRIVFEKTAMIKGNVILQDGGIPYDATETFGADNATLGAGNTTTSVRKGVRPKSRLKYSCDYVVPAYRRTVWYENYIPGVQFSSAVMIAGDLDVRSNRIAGVMTSADTQTNNTVCAPRVLFMAPLAKTSGDKEITLTSSVGGNLVIEDTVSFGGKGRVYLDTDSLETNTVMRRTSHSLRVGGDLAAGGKSLGMEVPATSRVDGMCTGNDTSLAFGNHLVLTDAGESVIIGDATNGLTLGALVTLGDLRVEPGKGPLTVKTLHVGPDAELTANKDVKVEESLILQGELSGELAEASTIKRLTYGSRNTDLVKKAALQPTLEALSVQVGSGELRLEEVHMVKNLGLCSGTLSLVDTESTTDSTLHVTGQITVQNGMLRKDANDPGSISTDRMAKPNVADRYMLTYITPGAREVKAGDLEWFDPRDVTVNHAKAEIMVPDGRSLPGKLMVTKGKLTVDGMLTVGTSTLHRTASGTNAQDALAQVNRYSVEVAAGELHTKGQDVRVHGKVTVSGKSKLMTGGGDLHVLGRVLQGEYAHNTALVSIAKDAMVDLGDGTLMLGPATTAGKNLKSTARPDVKLELHGSLTGKVMIPKGSKETRIGPASKLGTVMFDGTKTPGTGNQDGIVRLLTTDTEQTLVLDSLSAMQGYVDTGGKKVTIMKDVELRSATLFPYTTDSLTFRGNLTLGDMGGLSLQWSSDDVRRTVLIKGNFTQRRGSLVSADTVLSGVTLHPMTTKTVMGDFMVASDASRYRRSTFGSSKTPVLVVHGDFHFAKKGNLDVQVEFRGKEMQEVMIGDTTALHSVTVNNAKGLLLKSDVTQQKMAKLTLRQGKIHSMPMDSMFMWTVQNVQAEQELRGRSSAQTGSKCGADNDEECKATILRGSRQSYIGGPVARHLLQGTAGDGFKSGGYLFPVGRDHKTDRDTLSYYRPLILQLPSDLNDTTAVTVSPVMLPEGDMPEWENLTVPTAGGSLTLDVHADLFWKVDLGTESLPTNTNIRLAAAGLRNVADASGLRIVQWDCGDDNDDAWENPRLAGRVPAQADASSFAINGYLNGVVNLTQEGIGLGSCAILGVAANGIENPIDQADLSGRRANLQFIHNLPLTSPAEVHLGDIRIGSGMQFRSATGYRPVGAGSHELKIQPAGMPAEQAITSTLSLNPNMNTVVIAHGSLAEPKLKMLGMRMTSSIANKAEVRLVHGSADLGAAQVQVMDPTDPMMPVMTLAGNLMLDEETRRYVSLDPSVQVMRVKSTEGDVEEFYELDLYGYGGQTLVLNLSGMRNDLTILGVDRNGEIVPVQTVTGVEENAELPKEFALHGNYPNPFNPSTRIQFDLPENAQVQIQIVDMLGREVITLPAQELEAGANRSVEMNAGSLASGTYLYRIMATGAESRHVKTGRMTLVK